MVLGGGGEVVYGEREDKGRIVGGGEEGEGKQEEEGEGGLRGSLPREE